MNTDDIQRVFVKEAEIERRMALQEAKYVLECVTNIIASLEKNEPVAVNHASQLVTDAASVLRRIAALDAISNVNPAGE